MVDRNHPCYKNWQFSLSYVIDAKLAIALNQSSLSFFQKIELG
jgi:hypothetical protein